MKIKFGLLAAVVLLCSIGFGQQSPSISQGRSSPPSAAESVKVGNVTVPPDKLRPVRIPKLSGAIVVDGKPDEDAWKSAAVFKDFYQTSPGNNIAPSKPTEVLMMYDEKNLYVAFKCWDEKDKIQATVATRDSVFNEDNVRMWLDTFDDRRRAYVIGFNPLGIQQDGIFTEGQQFGADFSVDIVMESKGIIENWGWSVEVKIPFKSLRYSSGKGKNWGFNVARNISRFNDEFDSWLPDDRNISGMLSQHGRITGLDEIKYERTLEIVPSVTISETGDRKRSLPDSAFAVLGGYDPIFNPIGVRDPGRFVNGPVKPDLSLNLKYTLSPNVTLDAAFNPDFAEVEADAPVVTANQRFPIFFEEKRPFFLEGKEIFNTPLQPFYSRTIVDPDVAAKITGKMGRNTFGILVASDNAPGNYSQEERDDLLDCQHARENDPPGQKRICGIEPFLDKNALFGVLRIKRDVGKENSIGLFASARTFPKNRNFTGGLDGKFKLNPQTVVSFQALATHSRKNFYDPYADLVTYRSGNGFGYTLSLDYTTDLHGFYGEFSGRTRDYRADAGFTSRTDTNSIFFMNRFSTRSDPKGKIIRANFNQNGRFGFDWKGRPQQGGFGANINLDLQGNMSFSTEAGWEFEKIYESEFGPARNIAAGRTGAFFGAPDRFAAGPFINVNSLKSFGKKFSISGFVGFNSNSIDYDFGGGPRFPRASAAFGEYLASSAYATYVRQLYLFQADPIQNPYPNSFPPPPELDPGKGRGFNANVGFEYVPVDPLRFFLSYTKTRLTRNDTRKIAFDSDIVSLNSRYQFSRFVYIRGRLDYDSLRRGAAGQLLFGWTPSPGKAFYVGYNDSFNYNGFSPLTGHYEPGFERNSRTFFIRMSYLFRKSF